MTQGNVRRYIVPALIAALLAGWLVGWVRGGAMKQGMDARAHLVRSNEAYRALSFSYGSGALSERVKSAQKALEEARARHAHRAELGALEADLHRAEREESDAPARIKELELDKAFAEIAFNEHSGWYTFYRLSGFCGRLFLNLLNLLVIPLVIASLVVGVTALGDIRHVGRTGARTLVYYFATTMVSVAVGIALVSLIEPGSGVGSAAGLAGKIRGKEDVGIIDTLLRVFVDKSAPGKGAFPKNIFSAMAEMNVLGVIVFTLFFGAALSTMGEKSRPVIAFFEGVNGAVLKMIHWVMYLLPAGVFGLVVARLAETGGGGAVGAELSGLGYYAATVITGLGLHAIIVLPLVLWFFTRRNPLGYASGMAAALFTAFSTASSSATLPTTLECAEANNRVSARAASFVLPIGATINMDGTALYEAVAVIFIAQAYNVPMDAATLVIVFLTATLAAVGAAGIPEAGLVTMVIVLNATGLPIEGIAMLLSIDWFLDRCRTTVNVWGDAVGAAVIDELEREREDRRPRA